MATAGRPEEASRAVVAGRCSASLHSRQLDSLAGPCLPNATPSARRIPQVAGLPRLRCLTLARVDCSAEALGALAGLPVEHLSLVR